MVRFKISWSYSVLVIGKLSNHFSQLGAWVRLYELDEHPQVVSQSALVIKERAQTLTTIYNEILAYVEFIGTRVDIFTTIVIPLWNRGNNLCRAASFTLLTISLLTWVRPNGPLTLYANRD